MTKRPILDSTTYKYYNSVSVELIDTMQKRITELEEKVKSLESRLEYHELVDDEDISFDHVEDNGC